MGHYAKTDNACIWELLCLLASDINIYSNVMHACKDQTFSHKSQTQPSWVYQREDMRQTAEGPMSIRIRMYY